MTRKFQGTIRTRNQGSICHFDFEVDDNASEEEIELEGQAVAFDFIEWNFTEIK